MKEPNDFTFRVPEGRPETYSSVGAPDFPRPGLETHDAPKPPLQRQVDGSHYKGFAIQPTEYIHKNGLGFVVGSVVKYVSRYKSKGGVKDLRKAIHCIEMLIELEYPNE